MKFQKISQASESEDDALDLSKPVYSLSQYVDTEEELVAQMFKTLKFKKIKTMLPPVLRNSPIADIQKLFVKELTGMSRTRILASINGEEVNTSSSDSALSDSDFDFSRSSSDNEAKADDSSLKDEKRPSSGDKFLKVEGESSNLRDDSLDGMARNGDSSNLTALDLIELEMRAKLIKTMLEKQPNEGGDDSLEALLNVKIKTEPKSPEFLAGIIKKEKITPFNSPRRSNRSSSSDSSSTDRSRSSSRRRSIRKSRSTSRSSRSVSRSSKDSYKSGSTAPSSSSDSTKRNSADDSKSKRKLTRKEFEERMKKAKMNRSYRKREDSDDDSFDEVEEEMKTKKYKKWKLKMQKKLDERAAQWERKYFEGMKKEIINEKPENEIKESELGDEMEEGEVLDKEEGEIDSNEEQMIAKEPIVKEKEEGACTSSNDEHNDVETPKELPKDDDEKLEDENLAAEAITTFTKKASSHRTNKSRKSRRRESTKEIILSKLEQRSDTSEEIQPVVEELTEEIPTNSAEDNSLPEFNMTLPNKSERQSISFVLTKKNINVVHSCNGSEEEGENISENVIEDNFIRSFSPNENIEIIGEEPDKLYESEETIGNTIIIPSPIGLIPDGIENATKDNSPVEVTVGAISAENSCDSNIDIIGFIEPKEGIDIGKKDTEFFDEELIGGSSWSTRWLQSDKVKTVVSDSKIMSKVRKKIQAKGKIEKPVFQSSPAPVIPKIVEAAPVVKPASVIGSMEEYEKIVGVKKPVLRKLPPGLDSADSEDSEDEALWSQIMKK